MMRTGPIADEMIGRQAERKVKQETSRFGPKALAVLLDRLGSPDLAWPLVHVAGTNGKGTVSVVLAALLARSGLRVGLFTSPHLISERERFRILDGRSKAERVHQGLCPPPVYGRLLPTSGPFREYWPDESLLSDLTKRVLRAGEDLAAGDKISYFEVLTAAACLFFKETGCDCCVFEVGLGGGLDATNALRCSKIAVLTAIGRDHEKLLGRDLAGIAKTKAGIINDRTRSVFLYPPDLLDESPAERVAILAAVTEAADCHRSELILPNFGPETGQGNFDQLNRQFANLIFDGVTQGLGLNLLGIEGIESTRISDREREAFVNSLRWAGRLSALHHKPLVLFDGAHNPAAIKAFSAYVKKLSCRQGALGSGSVVVGDSGRPALYLVVGFLADKDWRQMARLLYDLTDDFDLKLYAVTPKAERALPAEKLSDFFSRLLLQPENRYNSLDITACKHLKEALQLASTGTGPKGGVFICGSLYMYEEALQATAECFGED